MQLRRFILEILGPANGAWEWILTFLATLSISLISTSYKLLSVAFGFIFFTGFTIDIYLVFWNILCSFRSVVGHVEYSKRAHQAHRKGSDRRSVYT